MNWIKKNVLVALTVFAVSAALVPASFFVLVHKITVRNISTVPIVHGIIHMLNWLSNPQLYSTVRFIYTLEDPAIGSNRSCKQDSNDVIRSRLYCPLY